MEKGARQTLSRAIQYLALAGLLALAAAATAAMAAPLPPASGDWVIDPAEVVSITLGNITVDGNITLGIASELHLTAVRLVFADAGGKRSLTGPATSVVTLVASTVSAQVGPTGGGGYFFHTDGTLTIDSSILTGLSGPQLPTLFAETEGIHLTTTASSVTNSSISGAQGYAITITPAAATIAPRVSDNLIQNSGGGVFVGGFLFVRADAVIERNSFSFNTFPHIAVAGANPRIANNSFFGSTAGIAVFAGTPTVEYNTFLANLLAAVTVQGGGGAYEWNTVSAAGVAFQFSGATATLRNNSVSLSASFVQASASTLTLSHNTVAGALGPAMSVNGSTVTGRGDDLESTVGSPALSLTNSSIVRLSEGSLRATGASAVVAEGGSLTLTDETVAGSPSAIDSTGTALRLTNATLSATSSAPALWVKGGSLTAAGGSVTGGSDGVVLDNATADLNGTAVRGSAGWGVRSIHRTPTLSADELGSLINGHGEGDLLVEADLTVLVRNAALEPVAGATVQIESADGEVSVSGFTGLDGRAGPVRLRTLEVDSLNNEARHAPFAIRASFGGANRGAATASLSADQEVEVVLGLNTAPAVNLTAPATVLVGARFAAAATAVDAEGDPVTFSWSTDDGQHFAAAAINLSFERPGTHTLTLVVSDGINATTATHSVRALTLAEANRPPAFGRYTGSALSYREMYLGTVSAADEDGNVVVLFLRAGPPGAAVSLFSGTRPSAEVKWSPWLYVNRSALPQDLEFTLSIEAWDGLGSAFLNVTLLLHVPANVAPRLLPLPDITVAPGTIVQIQPAVYGSDADDPDASLRYSASVHEGNCSAAVAVFASIAGDGTALIFVVGLQPAADWPGTCRVTVRVSDANRAFDEVQFNVTLQRPTVADSSSTGEAGTLLFASLLAAAALGVSAFALVSTRMTGKKE